MIVTIDLNVVLDLILLRGDHESCQELLSRCKDHTITGFLPPHAIPTIYYILRKNIGHEKAIDAIGKLLDAVEIAHLSKGVFRNAIALHFSDFEDAVVAAAAESVGSDFIVTSNRKDFHKSLIPAISPSDILRKL